MTEHYIGAPYITHVRQPEDTEFCFAACVASAVNRDVYDTQRALHEAYVSDEDGSTSPPWDRQTIYIVGQAVTLEPLQGPEQTVGSPEAVILLIADALAEQTPVALCYKKNADPEDESYHWVLIAGYAEDEGKTTRVDVMDPLAEEITPIDPLEVTDMIVRSMNAGGVYAYVLVSYSPNS